MQPNISLGRVAGIQIGLHYSWLVIAVLITLSFAGEFHEVNPQWGSRVIWSAAIITGLLFFASIVVHELAHALVAKAYGLPVRTITLFALGGVASIEKESGNPRTEFWMGIAGPLTSFALSFLFGLWAVSYGWQENLTPVEPLGAVVAWLSQLNFMLAIFNLIPGFPLDGGRVLRAIVWGVTGDADRATRIAARVGQSVAFAFIAFGLWQFFAIRGVGSLWLALIGWFLLDAASASYAQVEVVAGLRGLRVKDIMAEDCAHIDGRITLQQFADDHVLRTAHRCFVVEEQGVVQGLITPADLKTVDRSRWPSTTVSDIKRPIAQLKTVTPDTPVIEALRTMGRGDVNQVPVMKNGRMQGILSRSHLFHVLQTRSELSM